MTDPETRLRAAARAAAGTVAPDSAPPLRLPPDPARRWGVRPGRRAAWLTPLASAAAVATVVAGSLAAAQLVAGHAAAGHAAARQAGAGHRPHRAAPAPARIPALADPATVDGLPPFAIIPFSGRIIATATGRLVGTAALPGLTARVAAGGDGRTFYAAVLPGRSCAPRRRPAGPCAAALRPGRTVFYRITVTDTGIRAGLLPIPAVDGQVAAISPAPDGSQLAFSTYTNIPVPGGSEGLIRTVSVASTRTGRERTWTTAQQGSAGGQLSWLADGHTLAFDWRTSGPAGVAGQLRLLDTAAPGGDLLAGPAVLPESGPAGVFKPLAISPDGSTAVGAEERGTGSLNGQPLPMGSVVAFSARTGQPTRLVHAASAAGGGTYCQVLWLGHHGRRVLFGCNASRAGTGRPLWQVFLAGPGHALRQLPGLARVSSLGPGDLGQR